MPKFDALINGTFTVEISKNIKVLADNKQEAKNKVLRMFNKFLDSFPFSFDTEEEISENIELKQLDDDDESLVYKDADYNQFVSDMEEAGFEVEHYRGRWNYNGPAVRCESVSDVMSKTSVECQSDNMGLDFIVYPR